MRIELFKTSDRVNPTTIVTLDIDHSADISLNGATYIRTSRGQGPNSSLGLEIDPTHKDYSIFAIRRQSTSDDLFDYFGNINED